MPESKTLKERITSVHVPLPEQSTKKYRELSESLWEIQTFDPNGPYREAECIPIIAPTLEITESAKFRTYMTNAADAVFTDLLERLEAALALSVVHCEILRCLLVRVKKGCQIYPHVDTTFDGAQVHLHRMQIVSSSEKPFYRQFNKVTKEEMHISPDINMLYSIAPNSLMAEENVGLNDNIHLLLYTQPKTGHQALKEELAKRTAA